MVNEKLVKYSERTTLLEEIQCLFRRNGQTQDHLVRLDLCISQAFVHLKEVVAVFFFNLEKAYDLTWVYRILRELHGAGLRTLPIFVKSL